MHPRFKYHKQVVHFVILVKKADVSGVSFSIPLRSSKKVLENSKFYKGKSKAHASQANTQSSCSYAQTTMDNIKNIVKIKKNFSNLLAKRLKKFRKC